MDFQNIETKQDSAAKLAETQGKPTANYLFAGEFNEVNKRGIQALVDRMAQTVKFGWGNTGYGTNFQENIRLFGNPAIDRVWLLRVLLEDETLLNAANSVTMVLERYKPKRRQGYIKGNPSKASGWRVPNFSTDIDSPNYDLRKQFHEITAKESWLDFKQEKFFELGAYVDNLDASNNLPKAVLGARGCGGNRNKKRANHYIRFRFRVVIGGHIYESVPTATLMMRASVDEDRINDKIMYVITYEYV